MSIHFNSFYVFLHLLTTASTANLLQTTKITGNPQYWGARVVAKPFGPSDTMEFASSPMSVRFIYLLT